MHITSVSFPNALAALAASLCLSSIAIQAQVDIPPSAAAGPTTRFVGGSLKGEYWKRPPVSILTDGTANRDHGIDRQIAGFGAATGNFTAKNLVYLGNDLSPVMTWLGSDSASYSGVNSNLDDGAFRFSGYINVAAPGSITLGTTSDDGARITIAGLDVSAGDGSHGDETHDGIANFAAAGLYPIEVTFFNGDWTSDGNNHSGNVDPGVHGGANFHLRVNSADVNSDTVKIFHAALPPQITRTTVMNPAGAVWAYNDQTATPGLTGAWTTPGYDTNSEPGWRTGTSLFGNDGAGIYDAANQPFAGRGVNGFETVLDRSNGRVTFYFRTTFNWSGSAAGVSLISSNWVDDGIIVYLNGTEVSRIRMPAGPVTWDTTGSNPGTEGLVDVVTWTGSSLVSGENTIAVELHQSAASSSDAAFALGLIAQNPLAPAIVDANQPTNRSVFANRDTTLIVDAIGSPDPTYLWYHNDAPMDPGVNPSAATAALNIVNMQAADGGTYFCRVANVVGSVDSRTATVTYVNDTNPPVVVEAGGSASFDRISLLFDGPVKTGGLEAASDPFSYEITGGSFPSALNPESATAAADGRSVVLVLTAGTVLDPDTVYTVTIVGAIQDLADNTIAANTTATFRSWVVGVGCPGATLETYNTGAGNAVSGLTGHPTYPNSPDFRTVIPAIDIRVATDPANPTFYNTDAREAYGGRIRGHYIASETGPHTFYFASDDNGEFWLSTDQDAAHKVLVARESSWSNTKEWTISGGSSSLPLKHGTVTLLAGHAYYFEALYKEGGGGDNCAVAVQPPSQGAPPANGADAIGLNGLGGVAPANILGPISITQQPADLSIQAATTASFSVGVNVPSYVSVCYQWRRDGTDIPGANGSTYSFGPVTIADDNAKFSCAVAIIGASAVSTEATLDVIQDVTPPVATSAEAGFTSSNIVVHFNELLDPNGGAQDPFAYSLPLEPVGTFTVALAVLQPNGSNVTLTVEGTLQPGHTYSVHIQGGVADLSGNSCAPCSVNDLTFSLSSASAYASAIAADNPIAYYRFNDAPPTAVNSGSLGAAANGTYNGGGTTGSEAPKPPAFPGMEIGNTALELNGTDAFVGTAVPIFNTTYIPAGAFTVSGWLRRAANQADRTGLWGQNDIVEVGYINNNTLEVWTDNGLHQMPDPTVNPFPNGTWNHLAIVSDGNPGVIKMYTNGVFAAQRNHSLPPDATFNFNIGGGGVFDGTGNFFNGQIDEVAVFDKALSADQIHAQFRAALDTVLYSFNDGTVPAGTIASGTTPPFVGPEGSLHLSDQVNSQVNYWTIPLPRTLNFPRFSAHWRTLIEGIGGADGISFNVGRDLGTTFTPEDGAGNGLAVCIDTYNNGAGDAGLDIKWNGVTLTHLRVPAAGGADGSGAPAELALGRFVDTSVDVSATGLVTFKYDTFAITAQIPGYTVVAGNMYVFAARTGGANEKAWIDDVVISATPLPGPDITTQPVSQVACAGQTVTFTVVANGTPPLTYQWLRKLASDAGFSPIAGATAATYTTPALAAADDQSQFKVRVSNVDGPNDSATATVTVPLGIPAASAAGPPRGFPGGLLKGDFWQRPPASILTDGNTDPAHRIDVQIAGFGSPTGNFRASKFVYLGNDLTPLGDWLSSDGASYTGPAGNLDDGAFRFSGFINITAPGLLNIGTTSDDGSRLKIGGVDVIANDGGHGDVTVDANICFAAAGLYPIEITYFNGDWTDGNPANHGGANFHLRMNGADINAAGAALLHPPGDPLRVASCAAQCALDKIVVVFSKPVQLNSGTYSHNLGFVNGRSYGATHAEVILDTDVIPDGSSVDLTIAGVIGEDGSTLDVDPTVCHLTAGFGAFSANFDDGQLPPGTVSSGTTAPSVIDGVLHMTELGITSNQNHWTIPLNATITLDRLKASWRALLGGLGQADGFSFNVGESATPGTAFTYTASIEEEGATVGLSVTVDTFDNGEFNPGSSDVGTEVRWNGVRIGFTPVAGGHTHGPPELMKNQFVDASVDVSPSGFVTFKYDNFVTTAQIPNFAGIRANQYEFGARTGGAAEACWLDDIHINDFALGAPTIGTQPSDLTVPENTTATFSVGGVNGTAPVSYQWLRDGTAIPGATGPSYSLNAVSADSGAKFSVRLANSCGAALSREATLTVVIAPVALSSSSRGNCHAIYVTYNKAVLLDGNYSVVCSNGTAQVLLTQDFNANDGGFTVETPLPFDGPWTYNAGTGRWSENGQAANNSQPNTTILTSPALNVTQAGIVQLTFVHRYSFEGGNWDGGQVRVSVNGGAFNAVPGSAFSQNGYNGAVLGNSESELKGQAAFVNNSPNYTGPLITSSCALGVFNAGDSIRVQFFASSDSNTRGPNEPQWDLDSLSVSSFAVSTINVAGVTYGESQSVVCLRLATDLVPDVNVYRVRISDVHDPAGQAIVPNPTVTSFVHGGTDYPAFRILERRYDGIGGVSVSDLTGNSRFPNSPSLVLRDPTAFFEVPPNVANDYGVQLFGWAVAPAEADYRFWVSADDHAELWIAEDGVPAHKHKIAIEPDWAGSRQYTSARACCGDASIPGGNRGTPPANGSAAIHLQAGQVIYLEGLMKEGGGGDNFSVAATLNDPNPPANDSAPISIQYFQPRRLGPNGEIFTRLCDVFCYAPPADQTVFIGESATFSFTPDGTPPWTIQWKKNGVDIPGANGTSYTTPPATAADNNAVYSVALGNAFSSTSCSATLHVRPDPKVVDCFAKCEAGVIHVLFNKPVQLDGTYTLNTGFVNSKAYGATHAEVVLSVDPLAAESVATVTIADVHSEDNFVIIPNPSTCTLNYGVGRFCVDFNDGQLPAGTISSGTTPPYVGPEGALHLTDQINSQANYWTIPLGGTRHFSSFNARWRTLIEGVGGADGMSFNVGQNVGTGFTPEEGAATGLSVQVDTYNNGTSDAGVEVKWNGVRIGFLPVGAGVNGSGAPPELALGAFVDTSVEVTGDGAVTFKYATYTVTGQIANFGGIDANQYVFAARTGGANEKAWLDDVCIQPFTPGPASIAQQPADVTIAQECVGTATFTATINGTPPFSGEWHSNGVVVASFAGSASTVQSYTTPPLCRSADGARYQLVLRNECGTVASREAVVTIDCDSTDTTPPVITCPANITATAGANNCAVVTYAATATDDCHLRSLVCVPPSGSCLPVGTHTVLCTATDGANHTATCSFTVTVQSGCAPPTAVISTEQLVNIPGFDNPVLISCNWWNACLIADGWSSSTTPPGGDLSYLWFLAPDPVPFAAGPVVTNCLEVGEHTIVLVVTDPSCGSVGTDSKTIEVVTAPLAIELLIEDVNSGSLKSAIPRKIKRELTETLRVALAFSKDNKLRQTQNALDAFEKKVRAQVSPNYPVEATKWIRWSQAVSEGMEKCIKPPRKHGDDDKNDDHPRK